MLRKKMFVFQHLEGIWKVVTDIINLKNWKIFKLKF